MISKTLNLIYVHIPKTAGNSVQTVLAPYADEVLSAKKNGNEGIERFRLTHPVYGTNKHTPLWRYKELMPSQEYREMKKVTTIRNPWDQMISYYFSPHRGNQQWNREEFLRFLKSVRNVRGYIKEERVARTSSRDLSQLLEPFARVLRFESLSQDFREFCHEFNIPRCELPRANVSIREHYTKYYDDELIDAVAQKFDFVIKAAGYQFGE